MHHLRRWALRHDLQRLATSYPHLECFRSMTATLDVQESFMTLRREKGQSTGLSALCMEHFGLPLSKRLQPVAELVSRSRGEGLNNGPAKPILIQFVCVCVPSTLMSRQTSDWGARPLAKEQLLYAALDAFCLLGLARKLPAEILQLQNFKA